MIGVLICTYNGEAYIENQIDSIYSQTVLPNVIYVFDDCSTDNTIFIIRKICDKYKNRGVNVFIKKNETNYGYRKNFMNGIMETKEDIIFLCDQDDVWSSDKVEKVMCLFKKNREVDVVFSNAEIVGMNLEKKGYTLNEYLKIKKNIYNNNPLYYQLKRNYVTGATMAIRRRLIDIIPYSLFFEHDQLISLCAALKNSIIMIPNKLVLYRQHTNNQLGVKKKDVIEKIKLFFIKHDSKLSINNEINGYEALERWAAINNVSKKNVNYLNRKINFLKHRKRYSKYFFLRFLQVVSNIAGYYRYTSGIFPLIKDLFIKIV